MPDVREEFEAYVLDLFPVDMPYSLARNEMVYLNPHIQQRWLGWQASRAALKVELPEPEYFGDHWSGDWAYNVEDTKDALREAGIEVKQP